ncbi:MAG: hypothetical protein DRI26_08770 [Chloroflexi bacterium]|nr:MAG: hypothetical protein DRI26_08770 [Chloroflexota bacterium]
MQGLKKRIEELERHLAERMVHL